MGRERFPYPVLAMLAAEAAEEEVLHTTGLRDWQCVLGEFVMYDLPPMGPEPFDPWAWPSLQVRDVVPENVIQAWSHPFRVDAQVEMMTGRGQFRPPQRYPVGQDRPHGRWWTLPVQQIPQAEYVGKPPPYSMCVQTTSGPWLDAPSVELWGAEDAFFAPWHLLEREVLWRTVVPRFTPRVAEVTSAQDWAALVEAWPSHFPSNAGRQQSFLGDWFAGHQIFEPDWAEVAQRYDVVHVTQVGYLECAYAPIPCLGGVTTMTGWGPDVALWLKDPR